ncbi:MAG: NAD(P)/FAD-dependent oxidoreductase [Clostridia bacterium]|nr:NAD(P)/FAD-dependent oxidoreductase [Clostridia bacterium]
MNVIVVGAGAAGMMAAITAAKQGNRVTMIEKTSSAGNKIKITGKGRCNITFDGDIDDFKRNIVKNDKFMYSSFINFSNNDVIEYFESLGVKTKVERGGRIFPQSDKAIDVVNALKNELLKYNVKIMYDTSLEDLIIKDNVLTGIKTNNGAYEADKVIICTGGKSYKTTGSIGECYDIVKKYGHNIVSLKPGLVPLKSNDKICKELQGLTLKNVGFKIKDSGKVIYDSFGEMLFAHFGLTGPIVLSGSSLLNRVDNIDEKFTKNTICGIIDMKPALDLETLDKRIQRDFDKYSNKEFKNALGDLLPQKLIPGVIQLSGINPDKKVHQVTREERNKLVYTIKNIEININGLMPIDIAIITCGGIDVKQVNPKTMESKIIKNLFFAGEILDVDAYTGGFNLQIAFSTAVAAGKN